MTTESSVLKIVPGVMAIGVLGKSMKMAKGKSNFLKGSADIMVGTAMVGAVSDMVK